jgi:hypothetical protein
LTDYPEGIAGNEIFHQRINANEVFRYLQKEDKYSNGYRR